MRTVSRFEADLLRILACFLRRAPLEQALPLVMGHQPRPPCLGRDAVELVQDSLARGCVSLLARAGGWRPERFLRGERPVMGRLWERTAPGELGLTFSRHTLSFLIWVTATPPGDPKARWLPPVKELTPGDHLVLYFAYEALRDTEPGRVLRALPAFTSNRLLRLAYPEDFSGNPEVAEADFVPWVTGPGALVLEALQPRLAERWRDMELGKARISDWRRVRALGQAQEKVLEAFAKAVEAAGRRDLARFLLQTLAELLGPGASAGAWVGELDVRGQRMIERLETHRAALALVRHLGRLQRWEREARAVGYFDEGYAAGQLWKADWEAWQGDALWDRAQAIIREIEPI